MPKKIAFAVIDGVEHNIPRFISRVDTGWQVRVSPSKYFADSAHGGTAGALSAAKQYRFAAIPQSVEDEAGNRTAAKIQGKQEPTGIPGVFWKHPQTGAKRIEVRTKQGNGRILYESRAVPAGDEANALAWARKTRQAHIESLAEKASVSFLGRLAKIFG